MSFQWGYGFNKFSCDFFQDSEQVFLKLALAFNSPLVGKLFLDLNLYIIKKYVNISKTVDEAVHPLQSLERLVFLRPTSDRVIDTFALKPLYGQVCVFQ